MRITYLIVVMLLVWSCTSNKKESVQEQTTEKSVPNLEQSVEAIKIYEDSLKSVSASGELEYDQQVAVTYAEKCLDVYHRFPKSAEAPRYLDKAHIIFASVGLHQRSVILADSLIMMYPAYKNREMVLESLAGAYDVFVIPRQKDKVKHYYELLLKENPKMDAEQRKQIENRLKYVDLTFDEYIAKLNGRK
ncbi:hypothetical protein [Fluviicola sp.]|jgi:hypothetical protein|uniref:hypothetical protein n=1 Tax=Fluviicola sp. TaxID=1917219 RepID=UPI00282671EF|nr:hypothetical protein [Fluviicola sp.]MDR0801294.1 hypothetical protein [Fluviicola sp.]